MRSIIGKTKDKTCLPDTFIVNGNKITDKELISNKFCEFFADVGINTAKHVPPATCDYTSYMEGALSHSIYLEPTDPEEIISIINKRKPKKSSGYDGFGDQLIKIICKQIAVPLSVRINKSLEEDKVPQCMKTAKIIPIFKSNDKHSFTNYRPISLLPVLSKVLEKVIHKRMINFCTKKSVQSPVWLQKASLNFTSSY